MKFLFKKDEEIQTQEEEIYEEEPGNLAVDVLENRDSIYVLAPVAGLALEDIDISVHDTTLSISGERRKPKEFYEYEMEVKNEECFWGKFLRKVLLPENMDFGAIKAVMENNLLVVCIPKIRINNAKVHIEKIDM